MLADNKWRKNTYVLANQATIGGYGITKSFRKRNIVLVDDEEGRTRIKRLGILIVT